MMPLNQKSDVMLCMIGIGIADAPNISSIKAKQGAGHTSAPSCKDKSPIEHLPWHGLDIGAGKESTHGGCLYKLSEDGLIKVNSTRKILVSEQKNRGYQT
jgi:hypothetical protein